MRVIRADEYCCMPWKNGGGETTEIAAHPGSAGLDGFDWRVSMARVARSGPFSSFDGCDRTLAILEGAGLRLTIAGRHPIELTTRSEPLSFPADLPTTATLADGPVLDLNVMTRRDVFEHALDRLTIVGDRSLSIDGSTALLLCRSGSIGVEIGGAMAELKMGETLLVQPAASGRWNLRAEPKAVVFVVRIRPIRR